MVTVSENKLSKTNYMVTVNARNTEAKFIFIRYKIKLEYYRPDFKDC
jgi:hypothetical protein